MRAAWMCARSVLRRRVWGTVLVALLIAVAGGSVLAAAAGARRTESAFPRLLAYTRASDVTVIPGAFGERVDPLRLAGLPHVVGVLGFRAFTIADRPRDVEFPPHCCVFSLAPDGAAGGATDRFRVLEGRAPRPDRVHELLVNEVLARQRDFHPGDVYRAAVVDAALFESDPADLSPAQFDRLVTAVDFRIVGIGRSPSDIVVNENQDLSGILLTSGFAHRYASRSAGEGAAVRLRDPVRDTAAFEAAVRREYPKIHVQFEARADLAATFQRSVGPYVDALWLFALAAGISGLLVLGQALFRLVGADAADGGDLLALGASHAQRTAVSAVRASAVVVSGAVLAVLVAVAASPLFPLGPARLAEPAPGVRVDAAVLSLGVVSIVALLLFPIGVFAWRAARADALGGDTARRETRRAGVAERLARIGARPAAVSGVRFALQRERGAARVSPSTALFGLVAAIATVGASLVFATNLDRLVTTPARFGWRWDAILDTYDSGASPKLVAAVRDDRDLRAVTVGTRGTVTLDNRVVPAFGLDRLRGDARPALTEGRWPVSRGEVAVGAQTLGELHRSVGDTVTGRTPDGGRVALLIVGRTLLPSLNLDGSYRLGDGAAMNASTLRQLDANAEPTFFLVDLRPGARLAVVDRRYKNASALGPQRPGEIQSYARVRSTPLVLAGLLALLGVGVLAHLLVTSVRARRRDLAILKTIGFVRRQVSAAVVWQATSLVAIALLIGVPLGVAFGRWAWRGFAGNLGVSPALVVPVATLAGIVVVAALLANLIAAFPARTAARTQAAIVLRSE